MLYTIAANLNDDKYKVENKWTNLGAPELSWKTADERKAITGWIDDAVYAGDNNKVSFGKDDYIADLDADNIANRTKNGNNLLSSMNQYYNDLKDGNADTLRTKEFLTNHSYKIGKEKLEDLKNDKTYKDTYDFLKKLKKNQKK